MGVGCPQTGTPAGVPEGPLQSWRAWETLAVWGALIWASHGVPLGLTFPICR